MPVFTAETARIAARKSLAVRMARKVALATEPLNAAGNGKTPVGYAEARLACVRAQLARVDAMLMTEQDPQRIDRLASAQLRLSEQERVLAGRPLPGQRRPGPERAANPLAWLQSATVGQRDDSEQASEPAEPTSEPAPQADDTPEPGEALPSVPPQAARPAPMAPAPGQAAGRGRMALALARNLFPL